MKKQTRKQRVYIVLECYRSDTRIVKVYDDWLVASNHATGLHFKAKKAGAVYTSYHVIEKSIEGKRP